jgi:hypothetical protein
VTAAAGARGWVTATAAARSEARAKARVSQQLRRRLWRRLRRGWRARAWVTAAATAAARGADTPAMRAALDALARLPADNDDDDKFADVGGGGGGGGGGRGTGGGMIIDPRSVPAAICQGRCCGAARTFRSEQSEQTTIITNGTWAIKRPSLPADLQQIKPHRHLHLPFKGFLSQFSLPSGLSSLRFTSTTIVSNDTPTGPSLPTTSSHFPKRNSYTQRKAIIPF